ncbi:MAG: DUF2892 domain-containing protein [Bacteroidales bacterium]|nr:DUF2892 domain-containing protein [Bacteroidales bacterium]
MTKNVGRIDKIIRISAGLIIGALGLYYQSWWGLLGLVLVFTALVGWCPLYCPFKMKTNK